MNGPTAVTDDVAVLKQLVVRFRSCWRVAPIWGVSRGGERVKIGELVSHGGMCAVTAVGRARADVEDSTMTGTTTAGPFARLFGALLVFVLVVAAVPDCAMSRCESMHEKGTLSIAASHCSASCEDRDGTIATPAQNVSSDATFTPTLGSAFVATAEKIEPPAALWSSQDRQWSAAPASVAIYLCDRSLLI